jgi:hypothetical protein
VSSNSADFIQYNSEEKQFEVNPFLFKFISHPNILIRFATHLMLNIFLVPLHEMIHSRGIKSEGVAYGAQVIVLVGVIGLFFSTAPIWISVLIVVGLVVGPLVFVSQVDSEPAILQSPQKVELNPKLARAIENQDLEAVIEIIVEAVENPEVEDAVEVLLILAQLSVPDIALSAVNGIGVLNAKNAVPDKDLVVRVLRRVERNFRHAGLNKGSAEIAKVIEVLQNRGGKVSSPEAPVQSNNIDYDLNTIRPHIAIPASETKSIDKFLETMADFTVAFSNGDGKREATEMIKEARRIDPVLASHVEKLVHFTGGDLWSASDKIIGETKAINRFLLSKGFYIENNILVTGSQSLFISSHYRIERVRLIQKENRKAAILNVTRLDKINIGETQLGRSAKDGLALVLEDQTRENILNVVLPALAGRLDSVLNIKLPPELLSVIGAIIKQDFDELLSPAEMVHVSEVAELLAERARVLLDLDNHLGKYKGGLSRHSLPLVLDDGALNSIRGVTSRMGQPRLGRDLARINDELKKRQFNFEPGFRKIIEASAYSTGLHETVHEFDNDHSNEEALACSNELAISPVFGIEVVRLVQNIIISELDDINHQASLAVLNGLAAELGMPTVHSGARVLGLFQKLLTMTAQERRQAQTRAHIKSFGPVLVTAEMMASAQDLGTNCSTSKRTT